MSKKIMLVEDSVSVRKMMRQHLVEAGFEVIEASDGKNALDQLHGEAGVDMLITDLNMPNLDGIGLIRAFRKLPGGRFIPVVMLTTESDEIKKKEGKTAGASAWIKKPFKPEQLLGLVRMVLC